MEGDFWLVEPIGSQVAALDVASDTPVATPVVATSTAERRVPATAG
jgi:hypothetical protein